ncbi:hypothetical protein EH165_11250 [Nakamurella antarctica]|uniref:PH domain-containing protein n=1 Tax=Nakamurella antarctica TaxID=1902245 RepID=A0A3G8ZMZ2_9ACTN|nr:hypothetical protein [Nakamurella antarctica]AZI58623.1 hypothetical protein EH165_11250 [Nakamurella antarctica]
MTEAEKSILTITPAHPVQGYLRGVHVRAMGLLLLGCVVIAVVAAVSNFDRPSQIWPPLALVAIIVLPSIGFSFWALRRSTLEVTTSSLILRKGRRPPLVFPREKLSLVREIREFKLGLGAKGPALLFFDLDGLAILTMSCDSWSDTDRSALLTALDSPKLEVVTEPLNRKQFLMRFPDAMTAITQKSMDNQKFLNYVVLATAAGVILWAIVSN